MSFANPHYLWFVPILLLVCAGTFALTLYQQNNISQWIDRSLWGNVIPEFKKTVLYFKYISLALALLFLGISMARPQWGEKEEIIASQGMDIIFLLDLSNSMLAEDVAPSRLNRAQTFIKKTLDQLPDDRVGVVGFAGSAHLAIPLTTDFQYVAEVVDSLDPNAIADQGTNIADAIDAGIKALERSGEDDHKTSRAFVLVSDGEDFGQDAIKNAQRIKEFGAGFLTFSVGTSEGAPIPLRNDTGVLQTYKKDNSSKPILTRVNKELMAKIADAGGGKYFDLVNADDAATILSRQLNSLNRDSKKEQRQVTKIDRYQWPLGLSICFLLLSFFIGYQKTTFFGRKVASFVLLFWSASHLLCSTVTYAQTLDSYLKSKNAAGQYQDKKFEDSAKSYEESRRADSESAVLEFNEATALAKAKKAEEASPLFNEATKRALTTGDYTTAAKSFYNDGVSQAQAGNLEESYDRLTKAVELSKISNNPELEKMAREALIKIVDQQKQQSQQDQKQGDGKEGQKSKDQSQKGDKGQDQQGKENQKDKNGVNLVS